MVAEETKNNGIIKKQSKTVLYGNYRFRCQNYRFPCDQNANEALKLAVEIGHEFWANFF